MFLVFFTILNFQPVIGLNRLSELDLDKVLPKKAIKSPLK